MCQGCGYSKSCSCSKEKRCKCSSAKTCACSAKKCNACVYLTGIPITQQFSTTEQFSSDIARERDMWKGKCQDMEIEFREEFKRLERDIFDDFKIMMDQELRNQSENFRIQKDTSLIERDNAINDYRNLESKYQSLEQKYDWLMNDLKKKQDEVNENLRKISYLEGEHVQKMNEQRNYYENQLKGHSRELNVGLETKLASCERRLLENENQFRTLLSENERLKISFTQKSNECEMLKVQRIPTVTHIDTTSFQNAIKELEKNVHQKESIIRNLEIQITSVNTELREKDNFVRNLRSENENFARDLQIKNIELSNVRTREVIREVPVEVRVPTQVPVKEYIYQQDTELINEKLHLENSLYNLRKENDEICCELECSRSKNVELEHKCSKYQLKQEEYKILMQTFEKEIEKITFEYEEYMRERNELLELINYYKNYIQEMEVRVARKNKDLFEIMRKVDDECKCSVDPQVLHKYHNQVVTSSRYDAEIPKHQTRAYKSLYCKRKCK